MAIGIMSALHEELSGMLQAMPDEQCQNVGDRAYWCGHWQGHDVVAVLSRVGKVAAATTATALIERFGVDRIVFTGVAGGLGSGVRVGDVVIADSFVQHDMDASPLFPRHEVPLYGRSMFDTDANLSGQLLDAAQTVLADLGRHVQAQSIVDYALKGARCHAGLVATGDRFVSSRAESQALQLELPTALAVEMEGAAVAQVCHDYGVPFGALRTISDRADDEAHTDFVRFVSEVASHYSVAVLSQWLRQLT